MAEALQVILDDMLAGRLERLRDGRLRFDYAEGYQSGHTPLSVSMPIQIQRHPDARVRPWIAGLLPDNENVLTRWAREFNVSVRPFDLLGTKVGQDCAGAVTFLPGEADPADRPSGVDWLSEEELGERLRDLQEDNADWLGPDASGQFSLAGAQAKTALIFEDGCWGVPFGATPTTHILKPAMARFLNHDLNEHLCLAAASRAGLPAARTWVRSFDGETALVAERYDRRELRDGSVTRIHQEDLCQALSVDPGSKYQSQGGPSPGDIADLMREVMPAQDLSEDLDRFSDALIWNWLIGGTDAHAKNYSLLLSGPQVRLAPLYDVASILPYPGVVERTRRLAMKLGQSNGYDLVSRRNPWPDAADDMKVDADRLTDRARELAIMAPDTFADAAAVPEVKELGSEMPRILTDLVADRSRRCLELLGRS